MVCINHVFFTHDSFVETQVWMITLHVSSSATESDVNISLWYVHLKIWGKYLEVV